MSPNLTGLADVVREQSRVTLGEALALVVGQPGSEWVTRAETAVMIDCATGDGPGPIIVGETPLVENTRQVRKVFLVKGLKTAGAPLQLACDASS